MTITRKLIRADGTEEELIGPHALDDIKQMIGADSLDIVALRHLGEPLQVMIIDGAGHYRALPVNTKATGLYRANCIPSATQQIRGDAVIVPDSDFARI